MSNVSRRQACKLGAAWAMSSALFQTSAWGQSTGPYADAKLADGPPPMPEKDSFTIVVLPDTQNYSEKYPEQFFAQTAWIVESKRDRNIACVLHLGDLTNHNTQAEWDNATKAMFTLDGEVPYFMVPGNHDYSAGGRCTDRSSDMSKAFPVDKYRDLPTFGGTYDKEPQRIENSYHLFSAGGRDYMSLCLEFGPRKDVVRWANEVVSQHKNRAAILTTHAYMYYDDTRYGWERYGTRQNWNPHSYPVAKSTGDDVSDGDELWANLVSRHENFILTLNGHVLGDGLGRMTSKTPAAREINQVLVNFQMRPQGGDGWLRLLEFKADGKTVEVFDYSPTRNQRNEAEENRFTMKIG